DHESSPTRRSSDLGSLCSALVLSLTNIWLLLPDHEPRIWLRSGCEFSETAADAAFHAGFDDPIFFVPLDQSAPTTQRACRKNIEVLSRKGFVWLQIFPSEWMCNRLAVEAKQQMEEQRAPVRVPAFYLGESMICEGLCDDAFVKIARPNLQHLVKPRPTVPVAQ